MLPGHGVIANVGGQKILAGNLEMLTERKVDVSDALRAQTEQYPSQGCTVT